MSSIQGPGGTQGAGGPKGPEGAGKQTPSKKGEGASGTQPPVRPKTSFFDRILKAMGFSTKGDKIDSLLEQNKASEKNPQLKQRMLNGHVSNKQLRNMNKYLNRSTTENNQKAQLFEKLDTALTRDTFGMLKHFKWSSKTPPGIH